MAPTSSPEDWFGPMHHHDGCSGSSPAKQNYRPEDVERRFRVYRVPVLVLGFIGFLLGLGFIGFLLGRVYRVPFGFRVYRVPSGV